ncbi:MAG: methyltransferase domain-containing protein [Actinomycetota bacterium]
MTADQYMHGHHDSVLRSHRWRTAANSAAYLLPDLTGTTRLLDVGCGPGTITLDLARRIPAGHVTGIDAADEALAGARAAASREPQANVRFERGDVCQLSFADDAFDVVHAHQVLQHLADPVAALAEMRRVCRPGGVVAVRDGDYGGMCWYPEDPELTEWRALYQRIARAVHGEPDAGRRILAWARAAGFTDIRPSASVWCYATPDERAWWGDLWADRVTQSSFGERAIAHHLATQADLDRLAGAWRRWASSADGWFLIPHGEVLCRA